MTTEIYYYNKAEEQNCKAFCELRDIDCLPSTVNHGKFHHYDQNNKQFIEYEVDNDRMLKNDEYIFNPGLLEKFGKNPTQFVFEDADLVGIIHFSDYNKPSVSGYLYEQLYNFERNLRTLLIKEGFTNQDMLNYFKSKSDNENFNKRYFKYSTMKDLNSFPEFQKFDFSELIYLLANKKIISIKQDIIPLRNTIMHAKDKVLKVNQQNDDLVYNRATFEEFFKRVQLLLAYSAEIDNLLESHSNA